MARGLDRREMLQGGPYLPTGQGADGSGEHALFWFVYVENVSKRKCGCSNGRKYETQWRGPCPTGSGAAGTSTLDGSNQHGPPFYFMAVCVGGSKPSGP